MKIPNGKKGKIIYEERNRVIEALDSGHLFMRNPTSHGERQIISWYWKNKEELRLPDPQDLTIITTLDPCLMCAAGIIKSGFNVGIITIDEYGGVNYANN
jgi:cytosine deaminase